jgi:hypothetical protein
VIRPECLARLVVVLLLLVLIFGNFVTKIMYEK